MTTVDKSAAHELNGLVEDIVAHWCAEQAAQGNLVAGQTAWKLVSAYAYCKELQMAGALT